MITFYRIFNVNIRYDLGLYDSYMHTNYLIIVKLPVYSLFACFIMYRL